MRPLVLVCALALLSLAACMAPPLAPATPVGPHENESPTATPAAFTPYPGPPASATALPPSATPPWLATFQAQPHYTVAVYASPTPGGPPPSPTPVVTSASTSTPVPRPTYPPFPEPPFEPTPGGAPPDHLQQLWFPHYPAPGISPRLSAVLLDAQERRWGQLPASIDIGLADGWRGIRLFSLDAAPSGRYLLARIEPGWGPGRTVWIDPAGGTTQELVRSSQHQPGPIVAWKLQSGALFGLSDNPPDPSLVALLGDDFVTLNLPEPNADAYVNLEVKPHRVGLFYSPTDNAVADIWRYPSLGAGSEVTVEVALYEPQNRARTLLARFLGGTYGGRSTLAWSPDGRLLALTVSQEGYTSSSAGLWLVERDGTGLRQVATGVVPWPLQWSPDGRYLAYLKIPAVLSTVPLYSNLYVFDPVAGAERAVTALADTEISALSWSPDSTKVALSLSHGQYYNEIWAAPVDGGSLYPLAGPAAPGAQFVWLP
jgi:hypothetical protein